MMDEPDLAKYWAQRYRLFSRFDEGIKLDRGQSASVTFQMAQRRRDAKEMFFLSLNDTLK